MAAKSRRKTLSHAEIDSFLNELGSGVPDVSKTRKCNNEALTDENAPPPLHNGSTIATESSLAGGKQHIDKPSSTAVCSKAPRSSMVFGTELVIEPMVNPIVETINEQHAPTEEVLIREYCQVLFRWKTLNSNLVNKRKKEIGRLVVESTHYAILPHRLVYPETFQYSASSLEGKKALLISMSPSLAEAEKQRKLDASACEEFTRCRVGKGRTKFSSYDYKDIDMDAVISEEEYEKRYRLFLDSIRPTVSSQVTVPQKSLPMTTLGRVTSSTLLEVQGSIVEELDMTPAPSDELQELNVSVTTANCNPRRQTGHRGRDRRITLSPTSARQMMTAGVDIDDTVTEDQHNDQNQDNDKDLETRMEEKQIPSQVVDDFCQELDALLADDDDCSFPSQQPGKGPGGRKHRQSILLPQFNKNRKLSLDLPVRSAAATCNNNNSNNSNDIEEVHDISASAVDMLLDTPAASPSSDHDSDSIFATEVEEPAIKMGQNDGLVYLQQSSPLKRAAASSEEFYDNLPSSVAMDTLPENLPNRDVAVHFKDEGEEEEEVTEVEETLSPSIEMETLARYEEVVSNEMEEAKYLTLIEQRAYARMCVRFEQMRWKYQWELNSAKAALEASKRFPGSH